MIKNEKISVSNFYDAIANISAQAQSMDDGDTMEAIATDYTNQVQRALDSYDKNDEIRICHKCHLPLLKNSLAYDEGFHFDTCF